MAHVSGSEDVEYVFLHLIYVVNKFISSFRDGHFFGGIRTSDPLRNITGSLSQIQFVKSRRETTVMHPALTVYQK